MSQYIRGGTALELTPLNINSVDSSKVKGLSTIMVKVQRQETAAECKLQLSVFCFPQNNRDESFNVNIILHVVCQFMTCFWPNLEKIKIST